MEKHSYGWDLLQEDEIPISPVYFEEELPPGTIAEMWAEVSIIDGKTTRHPPSFPKPTNVGKSNERHEFKQAMVDARSKWLKKRESGYLLQSEYDQGDAYLPNHARHFPMLLWKYSEESKHIEFPAYVQRKLDGQRFISYLKEPRKTWKDVEIYSRLMKVHGGMDYIKKLLFPPLLAAWNDDRQESYYVDGEFYRHGKNLQQIGSLIKDVRKTHKKTKSSAELWVFDAWYPSQNDPYEERKQALDRFFESFPRTHWIRKVRTTIVRDDDALQAAYQRFIAEKYEGAIVRDKRGLYLSDPIKNSSMLRSRHVLKMKKRFSKEFPVVGFEQGVKGKDKGAILWTIDLGRGQTLTLQPKNMTYQQRYECFKSAAGNFDNLYRGRLMTVEYEDLSKDGVPLRAKAAGFRLNA